VKILHLESGRHLYGGPRQVGYLINGLADHGIENLLVCRERHVLAEEANARVFEWRLGGDFDFSLRHRLAQLIREQSPDVIHVHSRRGADTFGGRGARAAGVPAVLTRRVQSAEPGVWLRFKCRPYNAIAAISVAVRDELTRLGIAGGRVQLISSAVDTELFKPDSAARATLIDRFDLPSDALIAGSAAQLIYRKGQDLLLPLAARLKQTDPSFRLLLFGQGPMQTQLKRDVARLGLDRHIVFGGFVPEWPRLLPGLDLLLHPARREGLGAVVLEAMSAGVPVIASAAGGIVDAIEDGIDGRLVAPDSADDWYSVVRALLRDPDERARLGTAGRRKVESRFTIEKMTESYLNLYREVVGSAS